jgi:hypothetical protein
MSFRRGRRRHRLNGWLSLRRRRSVPKQPLPDENRSAFINRAGVRLLLGDAKLWQHVQYFVRGNLQLPCQLVNADFTHMLKLQWSRKTEFS